MNKKYITTLTLIAISLLNSCVDSKISLNENIAQLTLGFKYDLVVECYGKPKKIIEQKECSLAYWSDKDLDESLLAQFLRKKGQVGTSYRRALFAFITPTKDVVRLEFSSNHDDLVSESWLESSAQMLEWNEANANDDLSTIKRLESEHPIFREAGIRQRGCMQAARYDSPDVLLYYLKDCGLDWKQQRLFWQDDRSSERALGFHSYYIAFSSVHQILVERNHKQVREELARAGLVY